MERLRLTLKLLGLLCAAGLCLGATFTWTAGGDNDYWANGENWSVVGLSNCAHPCADDDATIPYDAGGYTVILVDEEMDDLTILGSVEFLGAGANPMLTVESLTLSASSGDVIVEFSAATISVE